MLTHSRARAVFLDRDGTLIEDVGHVRDSSQVVFFADTTPALQSLAARFRLFIVTNQPGVAEGIVSRAQVRRVNAFITGYLRRCGIPIEQVYYCPHKRSDGCRCIKPNAFFLDAAAAQYGLDLTRSYVVGDHPHDMQLALNAGARGVYVLTGHGLRHRTELQVPCRIAEDIGQAAQIINGAAAANE